VVFATAALALAVPALWAGLRLTAR
jgi:hypothetical protein